MRTFGVIMLSLACLLYTALYCSHLKQKNSALKQCVLLVSYFRTGILYGSQTLFSLLHQSVKSEEFRLLKFLYTAAEKDVSEPFCQVWKSSLSESGTASLVGKEAEAILVSFGDKLGKTDKQDQLEMCERFISELERLENKECEKLSDRIKLSKTAGAAAALLVIILFIR